MQPQIAGESDKSGRPRPVDADQPREKLLCDIIISAIGQATDLSFFEKYGIPVFRGNIKTERTNVVDKVQGIYAGGDCVTGPSTVINAIAAGKGSRGEHRQPFGYNHEITCDIEIPVPQIEIRSARGRIELKRKIRVGKRRRLRRGRTSNDETGVLAECSRCLRCDACGFGSFRGGRIEKMVKLKIDGQKFPFLKGRRSWKRQKKVGIKIPHLCYPKDINEIGACRVCLVEKVGMDKLVTACNTEVEEGIGDPDQQPSKVRE